MGGPDRRIAGNPSIPRRLRWKTPVNFLNFRPSGMGPNCRSEYHAQKCKATPDEDQRKQRETHPSRDNLNDVTELARDRNPGPSPHYLSWTAPNCLGREFGQS